ncbi:MAG TPA: DNA alkylation repair protein [Firmicutes bacterium]|nr:DNA alkylation repair protein [Bacillota bacterium]
MEKTVKERILELADEKYRQFQSKLLPDTVNLVGVRLPELRALAKELAKGDWRHYPETAEDELYEETMVQGLVIGYAKADVEEILRYVAAFMPKINNWGTCDSFCSNLKITRDHPARVWEFLQPYLSSHKEFEVRFAVVMLLNFYINLSYIDKVLASLATVKQEGYYARMAVAWTVSICFVKFPEKTLVYLQNNNWDDFTYNKALQKIRESRCVDKETKALIGRMKR